MSTSSNSELWEAHADWWQREFTDGVDPEYTEQILPLVAEWTAGHPRGCSRSAPGRARSPAPSPRATARAVVGVDPTVNQIVEAARRGGGPRLRPVRGRGAAVPAAPRSTPWCAAWCSSTSTTSTRRWPRWPGCCGPGGRFVFCLNHPLLQTPGSGWIDDQILDPPEQYWRVGPYLTEQAVVEQVEKGVFIRFVHRPLGRYVNAMADVGPHPRAHARASAARRASSPGPTEYVEAATIPRLLTLVARRA